MESKAYITDVTVSDVKLEFDRLDDGTKTNLRYTAVISANAVSRGKMTLEQFKDEIFKAMDNE
jgi:hypothetical protein